MKELKEVRKEIDREMSFIEQKLNEEVKAKEEAEETIARSYGSSRTSSELYQAFGSFCLSLEPQFGLRSGFSIGCHADHRGFYLEYGSQFEIFKKCIQEPYDKVHFRSEDSEKYGPEIQILKEMIIGPGKFETEFEELKDYMRSYDRFYSHPKGSEEYVVEFWSIEGSDPQTDSATWGEKYVSDEPTSW